MLSGNKKLLQSSFSPLGTYPFYFLLTVLSASALFMQIFLAIGDNSIRSVPQHLDIHAEISFHTLPSRRARSVRYDITIHQSNNPEIADLMPLKARVYCYASCPQTITPDARYSVQLTLQRPDYPVNPSAFDYQQWLRDKGFALTGTMQPRTLKKTSSHNVPLRSTVMTSLQKALLQHNYGGHYLALLTGFRGQLTTHEIQVLLKTGTIHLLVVSGLHLGLIFLIVYVLGSVLMPHSQSTIILAGLAAMFAYTWLAGFVIPTQRAFIMALVATGCFCLGRRINPWFGWLLALVLVLIINTPKADNSGLWLSFTTVAMLLVAFQRQNRVGNWMYSLAYAQLLLFPGLCLLQAVFFDRLTPFAIAANYLAIPFVGFIMLPALLATCVLLLTTPVLAHVLLDLLDGVYGIFWNILVWMSNQPWSDIHVSGEKLANPLLVTIAAILVLLHLLPKYFPGKYFSWLILPLLALPMYNSNKVAEILLLESNTGAHMLYRKQDYGLLISDTTPHLRSLRFDIVPTLAYLDIQKIDWTTLSVSLPSHLAEIQQQLSYGQQLRLQPPCQQSLEQIPVQWRQLGTRCLAKITNTNGTLLFLSALDVHQLRQLQPEIESADYVFLDSKTAQSLSKLTLGKASRTCILQQVHDMQLPCTVHSLDQGALRITLDNWQIKHHKERNWL